MTNKDILSERIAFYLDADGNCHWKYLGMIDDSSDGGESFDEEIPEDLNMELGTCRVCGKNPIRYNFILQNTVPDPEPNWKYVSVGSECVQFLSREDFLRIKRDQKRLKEAHDRINAKVFGEYLRDHVVGNQALWNITWKYFDHVKNLGGSVKFLMNECLSGKPMHEKTFGKEVKKALKNNGIELPNMKEMKVMTEKISSEDFRADMEAEKRAESAYEKFYESRAGVMNDPALFLGASEPEPEIPEEVVKMVPEGYELVDYYGLSPLTRKREVVYMTLKNTKTGEEEFPDAIPDWNPVIEVVNAVDWNYNTERYEPIDVMHVHLQEFINRHRKTANPSDNQVDPVLKALKLLAGDDPDFAATRNNVGFNKMDADFGHSLAANNHLSDKQREYGKKLLRKYHRQIPSDLWIEIFGDAKND